MSSSSSSSERCPPLGHLSASARFNNHHVICISTFNGMELVTTYQTVWPYYICLSFIICFAIRKSSFWWLGTQWILGWRNGSVKEGCIPEDWKSSVVIPIYNGKGDAMECGSYRGIKLLEYAMKVVERNIEQRIRQQIDTDNMQSFVFWSLRVLL